MSEKIIKEILYRTTDGCQFESLDDAESHQRMIERASEMRVFADEYCTANSLTKHTRNQIVRYLKAWESRA